MVYEDIDQGQMARCDMVFHHAAKGRIAEILGAEVVPEIESSWG